MALSDYPKASNALLTQEEKVILDDLPDSVVATFLNEVDDKGAGTFTGITETGVYKIRFEGERLQAVKDYFEMLFEFGVRDRPAND